MKALALIVILAVICIVLFIVGVIVPRWSRKLQHGVDELSKRGEVKGDRNAGKLGDITESALKGTRRAADASARAGRRVNDKITPD